MDGSACNYNTYGDVMKLNPTGASNATAKGDNLRYEGRKLQIFQKELVWLHEVDIKYISNMRKNTNQKMICKTLVG